MLTNTPGVLDKEGKLLTGLTPKSIDDLVAEGRISGGMLPKIGFGARRGAERREERAHHRRPGRARAAARDPDGRGRRHVDPFEVMQPVARRMRARAWIFDLDNTLHNASPHIFPHLNRSMTEYLERHLDLDTEEAGRLRRHYWKRYGATLLGLMRHHAIDPTIFCGSPTSSPTCPR